MARLVTSAELRSFAADRTVSEQATIRRNAASRSPEGATFLSHSSKDEDLVIGATLVLENHGARVYVDEVDPEMPPYTSEKTAKILKGRISQSRKFVVLTSQNSKNSRWVPWELGIADGLKTLDNIALFPSSETAHDTSWSEWEYLGLYHRIAWGRLGDHPSEVWMVLDHKKNTATELGAWLRR